MNWLQWPLIIVSVNLQVLVISALLKGAYKRYPFALAYSVALFLTTVMDVAGVVHIGEKYKYAYYCNAAIRQLLILCVVISLVDRALALNPHRQFARVMLVLGPILIVGLSLYSHRQEKYVLWMTKTSRDLSFCLVIINLVLWVILITSRRKGTLLLLISGGLGIQFTGAAVGDSLRQLSPSTVLAGNLSMAISHLLCLYIWWQAFRRSPQELAVEGQGDESQEQASRELTHHHRVVDGNITILGR